VSELDFTECVELLRKACIKPEFDARSTRLKIDLLCICIKIRWQQEILAVSHLNVDYRALDADTISVLAELYRSTTGREPRGMSVDAYGSSRRYAANPFPELVKEFFAARGRPIGDEQLHKMIKAARKKVPTAFPSRAKASSQRASSKG